MDTRQEWVANVVKPACLVLLVAILILVSVLPQSVAVQAAAPESARSAKIACDRWYSVRSNDTLGKIASRFGVEPYQIVNTNKIGSPYTIYMGQQLCIPNPAVNAKQLKKLPKKYLNQGAASFNVTWDNDSIIIKPLNFPTKSRMLVKVDDMSTPAVKWDKIGLFTSKKSPAQYRIKLPRGMKDVHQLNVCLKDQRTDFLMCRMSPYQY
jgi:LysM repeat protein